MKFEQNIEPHDTHAHILTQAIPLFAARGYDGVSMRNISAVVGISAAALYHHFPDKQALYLDAIRYAFADKSSSIKEVISTEGSPAERLHDFICQFTQMVFADPEFLKLIHREMLDGDDVRLKLLVEQVFGETHQILNGLIRELTTEWDPVMLMSSITGLVIHHYEASSMRRFIAGAKPEHEDPSVVANHVNRFIRCALDISPHMD